MKVTLVLAVLATALFACGCAGMRYAPAGSVKNGAALELSRDPRAPIPDFPVQIGFRLDENLSRSFAAGGARLIYHVYRGRGNKFEVARFYRREMASNRWVLVTDRFVQGEIRMDFEKETERCDVAIRSGSRSQSVEILVELFTSGRIRTQDNQTK